jgi:outer membrane protein TolC
MFAPQNAGDVVVRAVSSTFGQRPGTAAGIFALICAAMLSGCASFSPDEGMAAVANAVGEPLHKDVVAIRTVDDATRSRNVVDALRRKQLTADSAVQIALLNNSGLQAAYNELALAEAGRVQESLPPNPTFSLSNIAGGGGSEIERQVIGDILALATLPFRSDVARDRFRQAQLRAALETLRLAAGVRRAYYRAIAAIELVGLLTEAEAAAQSTEQLAKKLGETGSMSKLDLAREEVFLAETATDLATARLGATSARERFLRLLGFSGDDLDFRLPNHLPALPAHARTSPAIEVDAVGHRLDLQIARLDVVALSKLLDLAKASRFVTVLDLAGVDKRIHDPGSEARNERGFDVTFQIPIFDGGEVKVRQAVETYNVAFNRLAEKAVNVRSEAREAYRTYRSAYDIAARYQRDILPLRKIISDEMQLRLSSMQVDVFALVTEAHQRLASLRAAIDAKRDYWLAHTELQAAINGGGKSDGERDGGRPSATAQAQ